MRNTCGVAAIVLCLGVLALTSTPRVVDAATPAKIRIGVYDSRGVALAWARSPEFVQWLSDKRQEYKDAKTANDTTKVKELDNEMPWMQVRLHLRAFSTAGAGDLLRKVADGIPAVAREAGVTLIVSKWEMPFADPSVETVDVTVPLAKLFKPDEQTLKMVGEIGTKDPVPFNEMSLDPRI